MKDMHKKNPNNVSDVVVQAVHDRSQFWAYCLKMTKVMLTFGHILG